MTCPHAANPQDCVAAMLSDGYLGHDPTRSPWKRFSQDHDNCRLRAERLSTRLANPRPKLELPAGDEADEPLKCTQCGKVLCAAVQTYQRSNTGLCRKCYQAARKNPTTCRHDGCANKSRLGGYCKRHGRAA